LKKSGSGWKNERKAISSDDGEEEGSSDRGFATRLSFERFGKHDGNRKSVAFADRHGGG